MYRSQKAPLSPQEVAALQALRQNPKRELSRRVPSHTQQAASYSREQPTASHTTAYVHRSRIG